MGGGGPSGKLGAGRHSWRLPQLPGWVARLSLSVFPRCPAHLLDIGGSGPGLSGKSRGRQQDFRGDQEKRATKTEQEVK